MRALAIAGVNLRRLLRDRMGLFFIFVLPSSSSSCSAPSTAGARRPGSASSSIDDGALATELVEAIRDGEVALEVTTPVDEARLRAAVEDGSLELGPDRAGRL